MSEEKRSTNCRRSLDRRQAAEKADNWLAAERRSLERRQGERRRKG